MTPTSPTARRSLSFDLLLRIVLAIPAWFGSVFTTWLLIAGVADRLPDTLSLAVFFGSDLLLLSMLVQAIFTGLESPIWRGHSAGALAWAALVLETFINASGLWIWIRNLPQTGVAVMLNEALGLSLASWLLFLLALVVGAVLAYAPEGIVRRG